MDQPNHTPETGYVAEPMPVTATDAMLPPLSRQARYARIGEAEPADERRDRVAALELLLADVGLGDGLGLGAQREGLHHGLGKVARVDRGREIGISADGAARCEQQERQAYRSAQSAGLMHRSARIPCYSEACEV